MTPKNKQLILFLIAALLVIAAIVVLAGCDDGDRKEFAAPPADYVEDPEQKKALEDAMTPGEDAPVDQPAELVEPADAPA